ncbi:hypothetical protein SUGI_1194780 [Cryptomeria japonica]|nr:hypothetical protein SUGI_1194780 [Cryptomeria japonica]
MRDPGDLAILNAFKKGIANSELLKWPDGDNDPCGNKWNGIYCTTGNRVSQIQFFKAGLQGTLPSNFNQLTALERISLQRNNLSGTLPTFNGLSNLQYCYLGTNQFDTIPADFFVGLTNLQYFSLEYNNLNATEGWKLPSDLKASVRLQNLSLSRVNLVGPIPDFLGQMVQLYVLELAYNKLSGAIPSTFSRSGIQVLQLNNQDTSALSGSLDLLGTMQSLTQLWLHGNNFNGTIPVSLSNCVSLKDIRLNQNDLVGPIPFQFTDLSLSNLSVDNNKLTGPIPDLKIPAGGFSYDGNSFCQSEPGKPCAPEVTALLDFLATVNYPVDLAGSWAGNDPCNLWLGITCTSGRVSTISLPNRQLTGKISPSLVNLSSLKIIKLNVNNLSGEIPANLTQLKYLSALDVSDNNLSPPVPTFAASVDVRYDGNHLIEKPSPPPTNPSAPSPSGSPPSSAPPAPTKGSTPPVNPPSSGGSRRNGNNPTGSTTGDDTKKNKSSQTPVGIIVGPVAAAVVLFLIIPAVVFCLYKKKRHRLVRVEAPSTVIVNQRGPSNNPESVVKISVANNSGNAGGNSQSDTQSRTSSGPSEVQVMEAGNLIISVQILKHVTRNFSPENELGRGGFGVVYKGQLDDGTRIAVKRMEAASISSKGLNEFQSEIAVLSKVRHRHLVSLLGYCIEGNERLLVYEYMPQGALNRHLFDWAKNNLEPISWKKRLSIALDVARGMEYLHSLAHRSFIHRDLKPSNILLGDDFRAKVSDFGLVKLAPEGKYSIETRLAGTFGYLAPEYAVTGRITTKADVFSFGVVLMELITGRKALDENEPEESMHLVSWFRRMNSDKESFLKAIDRVLEVTDESFESMCTVAELAGHCTAREPYQRPDMGHAVNVLAPLVEKWKPTDQESDEYGGIDFDMTLPQALKKWQEFEGTSMSMSGTDDSKGSLPTRPTGFADSFTSADGR